MSNSQRLTWSLLLSVGSRPLFQSLWDKSRPSCSPCYSSPSPEHFVFSASWETQEIMAASIHFNSNLVSPNLFLARELNTIACSQTGVALILVVKLNLAHSTILLSFGQDYSKFPQTITLLQPPYTMSLQQSWPQLM